MLFVLYVRITTTAREFWNNVDLIFQNINLEFVSKNSLTHIYISAALKIIKV